MKKASTILAITLLATSLAFGEAVVGKPAPDFEAKDINGNTHRLSDYKGKLVVIEAYNLDCPFCANHFKTGAMQELQGWATEQGVVWLVVNSVNKNHPSYRTPEKAKQEFEAQKMKATAWIDDSDGKLGKAYGLKTTPHMVVIGKDGIVAYNGAIDDRPSSSGDPRTARNYIKEAIQSLLSGNQVAVKQTKPYGCGVKYE
ncbi:MAG: redoxin domain-containing protein [Verrucomicrobiae bacterium]|nr:redoxin domain-containing protein [Verrucomicrobiae bacterium]